ncbi:NUDIX domain-containing protein [Clostridium sulfidigenes]|uniref:NUDIX domain-containing protein n=1 Tax=Clostridium sulfidigenes TaxID=318464 RepID=UPI003F88D3D7
MTEIYLFKSNKLQDNLAAIGLDDYELNHVKTSKTAKETECYIKVAKKILSKRSGVDNACITIRYNASGKPYVKAGEPGYEKTMKNIDTLSLGIITYCLRIEGREFYLSVYTKDTNNIRIWEVNEMFEIIKGETVIPEGKSFMERIAIKGIVIVDDKLLILKTNKGDYKIPGGGQKKGEDYEATLRREFEEEVGCKLIKVNNMIGITKEVGPDKFDPDAYFAMTNHYYLCQVDLSSLNEQKLDEYEAELEIKPELISLEDAITNNTELINREGKDNVNPWVERELTVFNKIKETVV